MLASPLCSRGKRNYEPHSTDEEAEAQGGKAAGPGSLNQRWHNDLIPPTASLDDSRRPLRTLLSSRQTRSPHLGLPLPDEEAEAQQGEGKSQ